MHTRGYAVAAAAPASIAMTPAFIIHRLLAHTTGKKTILIVNFHMQNMMSDVTRCRRLGAAEPAGSGDDVTCIS